MTKNMKQYKTIKFLKSLKLFSLSLRIGLYCFLALCLIPSVKAEQTVHQSTSLKTFYPSPYGAYDRLHLLPMTIDPDCTNQEGMLYSKNHQLYICLNEIPVKVGYSGIWEQEGNNIYLTDTDDPAINPLLTVGIGTITPKFKLTLENDGGIITKDSNDVTTYGSTLITAGAGKRFIWYAKKFALRAGEVTGPEWNDANIGLGSIAFGKNNKATGDNSNILGGENNVNLMTGATILGGKGNTIDLVNPLPLHPYINDSQNPMASVIGGGEGNHLIRGGSFIGGGLNNFGSDDYTVIGGGYQNVGGAPYIFIGGGRENKVEQICGTIGGGYLNQIKKPVNPDDACSVIVGGLDNKSQGMATVIGGGGALFGFSAHGHIATGNFQTIIGGEMNEATGGDYQTIIGGSTNKTFGHYTTLIAGTLNQAGSDTNPTNSNRATLIGGVSNKALGDFSFVGGGRDNISTGRSSTIIGGAWNRARGDFSFVGGGANNEAVGAYSAILGGVSNMTGEYSFVPGGKGMYLIGPRNFVWGYSDAPVTLDGSDDYLIFPVGTGTVGIQTITPDLTTKLHVAGNMKIEAAPGTTRSVIIESPPPLPGLPLPSNLKIDAGVIKKDLAETFETSEEVEIGDVLVIDQNHDKKLKKSSQAYDSKVIGIVSGAPAIAFEGSRLVVSPDPLVFKKGTTPPVALSGRVLCKISLENGPIAKGDLLTTSSLAGHAMKATDWDKAFGAVVGRALNAFEGGPNGEKTGVIKVMVTRQ